MFIYVVVHLHSWYNLGQVSIFPRKGNNNIESLKQKLPRLIEMIDVLVPGSYKPEACQTLSKFNYVFTPLKKR